MESAEEVLISNESSKDKTKYRYAVLFDNAQSFDTAIYDERCSTCGSCNRVQITQQSAVTTSRTTITLSSAANLSTVSAHRASPRPQSGRGHLGTSAYISVVH